MSTGGIQEGGQVDSADNGGFEDDIDDFNYDAPVAEAATEQSSPPPSSTTQNTGDNGQVAAGSTRANQPGGGNTLPSQGSAASNTVSGSGDVVFPPELLEQTGMTEQEARERFADPEDLREFADLFNQQLFRQARGRLQANGQQQGMPQQQHSPAQGNPAAGQFQQPFSPQQQQFQQPPQNQQQQPPQQQVTQQQMDAVLKKLELGVNPDEWDPAVAKVLTGLNDHYHGVIAEQQQRFNEMKDQLQKTVSVMQMMVGRAQFQEREAYYDQFDSTVNGMDEYKDLFGSGTRHDMAKDSAEYRNRAALDAAVMQVNQVRQASGLPPLSMKAAISAAVRVAFPQQHDTTIKQQVTGQASRRQRMFTQRPSGRRATSNLSGEAAAIAGVRAILDRAGVQTPAITGDKIEF